MRLSLASALVLSLGSLLQPTLVEAAPILDQSFLPNGIGDSNFGVSCNPNVSCLAGQGFTVGLDGTLTSGELYFDRASGTLVVGLYDVSGPATLIQTSSTALAFAAPGFYSFAFNVPVTAGQTLALLVALDPFEDVSLIGEASNQYAGGTPWLNSSGLTNRELYFRTYVDTDVTPAPEPASMLLFGTGLAGLAARRYRRRS